MAEDAVQQTTQQSSSSGGSPQSQPAAAPAPASQTQTTEAAGPGERPGWLPETFWDAEKGLKSDDWAKHVETLTQTAAKAAERMAGVPDKAEGYELKLPEGVKLPDGIELNAKDPRLIAGREMALKYGIPQEGFEQFAAMIATNDATMIEQTIKAADEQFQAATAESLKQLGPQSEARVAAVRDGLVARLGAEQGAVLGKLLMGKEIVEAFEAVLKSGTSFNASGRTGEPEPGKIEGYEKMSFRERWAASDRMKRAG